MSCAAATYSPRRKSLNQYSLKMPIESLAVVLFAYNEKGNLLRLLRSLRYELNRIIPQTRVQYCVCIQGDDGSVDELREFMGELSSPSQVSFCEYLKPIGVRDAAKASFAMVHETPDAYLMMDCDLNHQPEDLVKFFRVLQPNSVVIGSRFCEGGKIVGMPLWKQMLSWSFNLLVSRALHLPVRDKTSGYRLIACQRAGEISPLFTGSGFDFYIEHLLQLNRLGLTLIEVPITFFVRTHGVSKMRIGQTILDYCLLLIRLRNHSRLPRQEDLSS